MTRTRITGALLAALVCVGAFTASSALAASTNNPIWKVAGANLAAGKTEAAELSANGAQTLSSAKVTIVCKKLGAVGAVLVGAALPGPGTATGSLEYSECAVTGADETTCKINGAAIGKGIIKTEALTAREAYLSKAAAETEALTTEETVTVFKPSTGELFAHFELTGTCPVSGVLKVEGNGVVTKNLGKNVEQETHEVEAPTTAITKYFENVSGATKEFKGIKLELAGSAATYSGKGIAKLTSKAKWNVAL